MPRTKLDKPKYPPIDWTMAAILERKKAMKLEWSDLAGVAGMSGDSLRQLVSKKHTEDWPSDVRQRICKYLDIRIVRYVENSPEDPNR